MTAPVETPLRPTQSLALRWIGLVTFAAGLGVAVMLGFTAHEMQQRLEKEGEAVSILAEQKTIERIEVANKLVAHRLRDMITGLEDDLSAIASLPTTLEAIRSRSDSKVANAIGKRVRQAGFSGAVVLDHRLGVIGLDRAGMALLSSQAALNGHDMKEAFRELIENNDRRRPASHRFNGVFDHSHAAVTLSPLQGKYGLIIAYPVFDDFGDPAGLIAAYRLLRKSERQIVEFAETTDSAVALMVGSDIVSSAGGVDASSVLGAPNRAGLIPLADRGMVGRCAPALPRLSACVFRSTEEITRFREEVMAIGIAETGAATRRLAALGLVSILTITLLLAMLTRRLTRPLTEITEAVKRVAGGEWRVEVRHAERSDEIGMIARAVAGMQISLIERDRMRQEMVRIDALNQRRLVLDRALGHFETGMNTVMESIAGTVTVLDRTSENLARAASEAEVQASLVASSTEETASTASSVSGATMQLSENIAEIGSRVKSTNDVVHRGGSSLRLTGEQLGELGDRARDAENAVAIIQGLVANLGHLALGATLEATTLREGEKGFAAMASAVGDIARQTAAATDRIADELARLMGIADGATISLGEVQDALGDAIRETSEISVVVAEQNAATREIAGGLAAAAQAMTGLTGAVDTLRQNIAGAHESTAEFVTTARRIVEDARQIDESVRSFIREIAA